MSVSASSNDPERTRRDFERHEAFMAEALEEARQAAEVGEIPVGAVLVRAGQIIARAHNARELDKDPTAHAELIVMREAAVLLGDWRLNECTLYVTLEPCFMCAGGIVNARVGTLVYGASDPKAGAVGSLGNVVTDPRLNHRPDVIGGVGEAASADLLRTFFRARRKGGELGPRGRPDATAGATEGRPGPA
ncbi:MAG: tRNA adenosine(34) deaminase TadA [Planctomycetota bacterium]